MSQRAVVAWCLLLSPALVTAQSVSPYTFTGPFVEVAQPTRSVPLRSLPPATPRLVEKRDARQPPATMKPLPGWDGHASPVDPLAARGVNQARATPAASLAFQGLSNTCFCSPPDTVGAVGTSHYVQMVNATALAVFDKTTGAQVGSTVALSSLWSSGACASTADGDPIVVYDYLADRWLLAQFGFNYICTAVSQSDDPTGAYNLYQFSTPEFPDYFKIGAWSDAYYMTSNENSYSAYALDRSAMLAGTAATSIRFNGETNFMMPATVVGSTAPPAGTPGIFYTFKDDAFHGGSDRLELFHFVPDFTTPANSSFGLAASVPVTAYTYTVCGFFNLDCIPQGGTSQHVDPVSEWPMWQLQYRNLGGSLGERLVANFSVDVGSDRAGIRWYDLQKTGAATYAIVQEGTYAPADSVHRWMGSIAMDRQANILLGYSASSTTEAPSLRFASRLVGDAAGTLQAEQTLVSGAGVQTGSNRWGDYAAVTVDPVDDCTFWFTGEYYTSSSGNEWTTHVGKIVLPECLVPVELQRFEVE